MASITANDVLIAVIKTPLYFYEELCYRTKTCNQRYAAAPIKGPVYHPGIKSKSIQMMG